MNNAEQEFERIKAEIARALFNAVVQDCALLQRLNPMEVRLLSDTWTAAEKARFMVDAGNFDKDARKSPSTKWLHETVTTAVEVYFMEHHERLLLTPGWNKLPDAIVERIETDLFAFPLPEDLSQGQ